MHLPYSVSTSSPTCTITFKLGIYLFDKMIITIDPRLNLNPQRVHVHMHPACALRCPLLPVFDAWPLPHPISFMQSRRLFVVNP
jgi:hypothetical protein